VHGSGYRRAYALHAFPIFWNIQRRRGGGKANIALARKFLGVIYHTLKNNWVFEDFPNFVLAS
jgi:transposase